MLRIGLTGGIGSGKSTVAAMFARRGVPVIDADEIARELSAAGTPAYQEIIAAFGQTALAADGELDRARLRALVFDDRAARERLETILHPRVRAEIATRLQRVQAPYCVVVVPLLLEAGQRDLVDRVLVVDLEEALQIERVAARSRLSAPQIRKIIAAQLPRETRLRFADDILVNAGDLAALETKVGTLHHQYLALARRQADSV